MELNAQDDPEKLAARALEALTAGTPQTALALLERSLKIVDNPLLHSHLGYCIAKERGQVKRGLELCRATIELDPDNPVHYLNLARVHQVAKQKSEAITALRQGIAKGGNGEIHAMLAALGVRKSPPLPFLARNNPLNKWLGILLSRIGLR